MTSRIPEKIAKVGLVVKLKDEDGNWTEGWKVMVVYGRLPLSILQKCERDYLKQRKASDV